MVNEAQNTATGGIPKTAREFNEWLVEHAFYADLTNEQFDQADKVRLSFESLTLKQSSPEAQAHMQELHDADMAKLEAMFGSQLSE